AEQQARYTAARKTPPLNWRDKYEEPAMPDTSELPELPDTWCWANAEQIISYLRNGLPQKPNPDPPGHKLLRISAVRPMRVDLSDVRYLDLPASEVAGYFVQDGDLLFTRYNGSVDLLGVAAMV